MGRRPIRVFVGSARVLVHNCAASQLEQGIIDAINRRYPGHIVDTNFFRTAARNGRDYEIDIETQNAIIEVKGLRGVSDLANQIEIRVSDRGLNPLNKPVVGYRFRLRQDIIDRIHRQGGLVVTGTIDDLLDLIRP